MLPKISLSSVAHISKTQLTRAKADPDIEKQSQKEINGFMRKITKGNSLAQEVLLKQVSDDDRREIAGELLAFGKYKFERKIEIAGDYTSNESSKKDTENLRKELKKATKGDRLAQTLIKGASDKELKKISKDLMEDGKYVGKLSLDMELPHRVIKP